MTGVMSNLDNEFRNRPRYQKLIMGYLAFGNSPYDLLSLIVEKMSDEEVGKYLIDIAKIHTEAHDEDPECNMTEAFLDAYESLGDDINSPIAG